VSVNVLLFPGSNCDHDVIHCYENLFNQKVEVIWHRESELKNPDVVIVPGGFSFGDYLRTGAMAKVSPVMGAARKFAAAGGPVLGICNGFQILCEAGLLPGVLLQNISMKFLSRFVRIKVESSSTPFTGAARKGDIIHCPIAHFEGNYFADGATIERLEGEGQVVFRYCGEQGQVDAENREWNPNGAMRAIAGITNDKRNVVGLMPHPERAVEKVVGFCGGESGRVVFASSVAG